MIFKDKINELLRDKVVEIDNQDMADLIKKALKDSGVKFLVTYHIEREREFWRFEYINK